MEPRAAVPPLGVPAPIGTDTAEQPSQPGTGSFLTELCLAASGRIDHGRHASRTSIFIVRYAVAVLVQGHPADPELRFELYDASLGRVPIGLALREPVVVSIGEGIT